MTRLVDLAERYEASAAHGVPALRNRQAWAVLSAAQIYGDIGRKVRGQGPEALERRAYTRRRDKLIAVALAAPEARMRALFEGQWSRWHPAKSFDEAF